MSASVDRSPQENRDRDVENLLGQFLVASFQTQKLSDLIRERFRGFAKDIRLIIPGNPPLSVSMRIEPYSPPVNLQEKEYQKSPEKFVSALVLAESPPIEIKTGMGRQERLESADKIQSTIEEAFAGLFKWWRNYPRPDADRLKLGEWKVKVSVLNSQDAFNSAQEFIRSLEALEAKRKGHVIGSP